nr:copper resistance CopC family protein [Phytoactinopolyspora alkaliphila]
MALAWGAATPAAAHNVLIDSTPSEGSTIESPPETVELVFDQYVQDEFAQVAVLDAADEAFHGGEPVVEDNVVTQAVNDLPDGDYTISYRVISADGHPVSGTVDFSVAAGSAEAADDASPADPDTPADGAVGDDVATTETSDGADEGLTGTVVTGVIVFAVLAGLALITARNRRRLRQSSFYDDGAP